MKSLQAIALFVSKSNRQSQTEADGINDSNIYSSAIAIDSAMDPACAEASRLSSTMAALSSIGGLFVFLSNLLATRHRICVCTIIVCLCLNIMPKASAEEGGTPSTILWNLDWLNLSKEIYHQGTDPHVTRTGNLLIERANKALAGRNYSVTYTDLMAPSGDPNDYVSYGPYRWPNPDTPDGLPWISRDGHINKNNGVDGIEMCKMNKAIEALTLGYFLTDDERYATKAADLLRTWYITPETRMNPNSEYALLIPPREGYFDVAGFANCMPRGFEGAGILEMSPAWTAEDKQGLQNWTREMLHWIRTTHFGELQRTEPANHGTSYDFLMGLWGRYTENEELARSGIENYMLDRMAGQILPDGSYRFEMERANNFQYSRYNLGRAMDLGEVARAFEDLDPLDHELEDGRGLRLSLEFLKPYMTGEKEWDFWHDEAFKIEPSHYFVLLRRAALLYQDPTLLDAADMTGRTSYEYVNLTHPRSAVIESEPGDFNSDGQITVADLDLFHQRMRSSIRFLRYDLDNDGNVNLQDQHILLTEVFQTTSGDANLDGRFDSSDLIEVFQAGEYEDSLKGNSTWATGDWNGNGEFESSDLIVALNSGSYEQASNSTPPQVPEPSSISLILGAIALLSQRIHRNQKRSDDD